MKKLTIISSSVILASMFAAGVLTTGCQKQLVDVTEVVSTQTPFTFTAGIDKADVAQTLASGIRDNAFNNNDAIGVYVVAYRKPGVPGKLEMSGNYVDNTKSTKGVSAWTNATPIYYPNVKVDIYAYAPHNPSFDPTATPDQYKFTVAANQNGVTEVAKYDFMTAQVVDQASTSQAIPMTFFHRLSRIDVKFTIPTLFKGKAISGVQSVKFIGFKSGAIVDLLTRYTYTIDGATTGGTYPKPAVVDNTSAVVDITPNAVFAAAPGAKSHYEAIVVPQSQPIGAGFVEIIVNYTSGGTEKFYYESTKAIEFQPSRSTLIDLQFQPDNVILLGNVDIMGWGSTIDENGSVAEKEVFNTFTLNLGSMESTQITTVDVTVGQGTAIPQSQTIYSLPAQHTSGTSTANFAFDGTRLSPEYYSFNIVKVVCKSASGATVKEVNCNDKSISASGAVTLPL